MSHSGECGGQDGREVCCDVTFSATCTCHQCSRPARVELTVIKPTGLPAGKGSHIIFSGKKTVEKFSRPDPLVSAPRPAGFIDPRGLENHWPIRKQRLKLDLSSPAQTKQF